MFKKLAKMFHHNKNKKSTNTSLASNNKTADSSVSQKSSSAVKSAKAISANSIASNSASKKPVSSSASKKSLYPFVSQINSSDIARKEQSGISQKNSQANKVPEMYYINKQIWLCNVVTSLDAYIYRIEVTKDFRDNQIDNPMILTGLDTIRDSAKKYHDQSTFNLADGCFKLFKVGIQDKDLKMIKKAQRTINEVHTL